MSVDWKGSYHVMSWNEQPSSKTISRKKQNQKKVKKKNLKKSSRDLVTTRSGEQMLLFTKCIQAEAFLISTDL